MIQRAVHTELLSLRVKPSGIETVSFISLLTEFYQILLVIGRNLSFKADLTHLIKPSEALLLSHCCFKALLLFLPV